MTQEIKGSEHTPGHSIDPTIGEQTLPPSIAEMRTAIDRHNALIARAPKMQAEIDSLKGSLSESIGLTEDARRKCDRLTAQVERLQGMLSEAIEYVDMASGTTLGNTEGFDVADYDLLDNLRLAFAETKKNG